MRVDMKPSALPFTLECRLRFLIEKRSMLHKKVLLASIAEKNRKLRQETGRVLALPKAGQLMWGQGEE